MSLINNILSNLPEVKGPEQKYLPFNQKLKWTAIILVAYFIMGVIPLYGLGRNELANFEFLSIILGAQFGSLISLGIGPIVTASIVLQLLNGSGILKLDTTTHEGRVFFQGFQKLLSIFFIIFESLIYVFMGGLTPELGFSPWIIVLQLFVAGILILYMDEVVNKWGFGSGISLFIAAGVASQIFISAFSPLTTTGDLAFGSGQSPVGRVWVMFISLFKGLPQEALLAFLAIFATAAIFLISVYVQAMKVEIPLSFGRIRGYGIRWPLKFIYTSNIPVILVAALLANVQLWATLLEKWGYPILGTFINGQPVSGFVLWIFPPNLFQNIFTGSFIFTDILRSLSYVLFMIIGSVIFSIFWVQTSGMDAATQSKQILASGLQIPGFRRDERVLERILKRYITPLTVMGAIAVGFLAAIADVMGALSRGTGILLAVMIIYNLYESIAQQHMMDIHPTLRKVMGK
ncbi:MAG: preprotein translocase subunit SecY [Nanoarchaeota archaeon]|mgnify:FL=1